MSALAALLLAAMAGIHPAQAETIRYVGASVWTGGGFETRDLIVEDGRFVDASGGASAEVSLAGRFVVPAYGNAHAHRTGTNDASSDYFLENGVFYVWNPTTVVIGPEGQAFFARPDTVDVVLAQGGITEPGGHPERLYVDVLGPMIYDNRSRESFLGDAFHYGRTEEEIDAALDLLQSQGARFVKTYLVHSEDYDLRRDDPEFYGYRGIDPDTLRYLVTVARERGMPVAVHVESAADLVVAAEAGAHMAAHLPAHTESGGLSLIERKTLTDAEAQIVARSGIWLVPTYGLLAHDEIDEREMAVARAIQAHNLRLLRRHGARFLLGTDTLGEIVSEAVHLDGLGVFPRAELVAMVLDTGAALFPDRRIGCFDAGCEADFLVLRENPLVDVGALGSIAMAVKAGRVVAEVQAE